MKRSFQLFPLIALLLSSTVACSENLTLKDGRVLRNYRIAEIQDDRVIVAFSNQQNQPDALAVAIADLPEELQKKYRSETKQKARGSRKPKTLRGVWIMTAEQLEKDLSRLPADAVQSRRTLAKQTWQRVSRTIAANAETVDLKLISADRSGLLLQVVKSYAGSRLRNGQYLYFAGDKPANEVFRKKIYPSGINLEYTQYGKLPMFGESEASATALALGFIGSMVDDNTLFLEFIKSPEIVAPQNENTSQKSETTVNNVYYIVEEDDNNLPVYYWNSSYRPPPGKRPVHRPDKRPPGRHPGKRPDKRPQTSPDVVPDKPRPGMRPAGGSKPQIPGENKSVISKGSGRLSDYGLMSDLPH